MKIRVAHGARTPFDPSELGGSEIEEGLDSAHDEGIAGLTGRVLRLEKAKGHSTRIVAHVLDQFKPNAGAESYVERQRLWAAKKLERCGLWLLFRHYTVPDKVRLRHAEFCKQHLLCPSCAIRRAGKNAAAYLQKIEALDQQGDTGVDQMVTLTVRNGADLFETFRHLDKARKRLTDRMRQARRRKEKTEFRGIIAGVGAYEVTNIGNGWHPHIHLWIRADRLLDPVALSREWLEITGDSHVVDVRPVYGDRVKAFAEIFKYATKFGDMSPAHVWEVWENLRGRRFVFSFGALFGVKVPESLLDAPLSGPFRDFEYRWIAATGALARSGGVYSVSQVYDGFEDPEGDVHADAIP